MAWKFLLVRFVSELTCLPQKRNADSEIVQWWVLMPWLLFALPPFSGESCSILVRQLSLTGRKVNRYMGFGTKTLARIVSRAITS